MRQRVRALLTLLFLGLSVASAQTPAVVRTAGVHVLDPAAGAARWLGPGGHPAWSRDGTRLFVEAHTGVYEAAPAGPLYTVDAGNGAARGLTEAADRVGVRVSPSGRLLAALEVDARNQARVVMLSSADGSPVGAPVPMGPITPRLRDAFAWQPGRDVLLVAAPLDAAGMAAGLWRVDPATGERAVVAAGPLADGVWPSPDGRAAAVRIGDLVAAVGLDADWTPPGVAPLAGPPVPEQETAAADLPVVLTVWAQQPGVAVLGVHWAAQALWLHTQSGEAGTLRKLAFDGREAASLPLPGDVASALAWIDDRAVFVAGGEAGGSVWSLDPATGEREQFAVIKPGIPLTPGAGWLVPAPVPAPDGRRLALALGRTDRWGMRDRDKYTTTDTTVAGNAVKAVRRGRNVGASGVVFRSSDLEFAGQARPQADSPVVSDTRGGGFRWQRPAPPRWVVLHHTATQSDAGSLNALTTGTTSHRIARLYEDITPGSQLRGEPNTISVHYVVLRDGRVIQLVEERCVARHAGTGQWGNRGPIYDFNVETIGIEIVGRGNDFTSAQVRGVGRLVADICRRNAIPFEHVGKGKFVDGVIYHRDFAGGLRGKPDPAGWPWAAMEQHGRAYLAGR